MSFKHTFINLKKLYIFSMTEVFYTDEELNLIESFLFDCLSQYKSVILPVDGFINCNEIPEIYPDIRFRWSDKFHESNVNQKYKYNIYEGEFREAKDKNIFEGNGIYIETNGSVYTGQFKNNMKNGQGNYKFCNYLTGFYDGEWKDDKMDGKGYLVYFNKGESYDGEFHEGFRDGFGIEKKDMRSRYEGEWKNDT
jgi:hypothetical protein